MTRLDGAKGGAARRFGLCLLLLSLSGCHSLFGNNDEVEQGKSEGKRVSVLEISRKPTIDRGLEDFKFALPQAVANRDWAQAGGNQHHNVAHAALAAMPQEVWRSDIGHGSSGYFKLLARPVVSGGKVFTLDARGEVAAFNSGDGEKLWRFDTTPADRDEEAMAGGIGVSGDQVYVTTGFGEVVALKAADGRVAWRKMLGKPFRAAPTLADGRVFVVSIDNELSALSATNGEILWHHNGIAENAALMGASNPAVADDSLVVAYSSGEIFDLRTQNGRVAWTDLLAMPERVGALPAIADIRGLPVIDRGRVFAVSHSGRMAAIDQRTGERVWEADIGGINAPLVSGNVVFVVDNDNNLLALTRDGGRILWIREMQRLKDPEDRDSSPVFWWGPVLAGGRLWLTNSLGNLAAFSPQDGALLGEQELSNAFFTPPIVAGETLYALSDNGKLIALR